MILDAAWRCASIHVPFLIIRVASSTMSSPSRIVALGGMDAASAAIATMERYDALADTWVTAASMTVPRSRVGVVVLKHADDKQFLYCVGGWSGSRAVDVVERYDPYLESWSLVTKLLEARSWLAAAALTHSDGKQYLYAIGGDVDGHAGGGASADVTRYDPSANGGLGSWALVTGMSTARFAVAVSALLHSDGKHYLYAIGGHTASSFGTGALDLVERYEPSANGGLGSWSPVESLPRARYDLSSGVLTHADGKQYLYVVGGRASSGALGDVDRYDPSADAWATVAALSTARRGLSVAALVHPADGRGYLYAAGGLLDATASVLSSAEIYNQSDDSWAEVAGISQARYELGLASFSSLCDPGLYLSGATCKPCPGGYICSAGTDAGSLEPCPLGFICPGGNTPFTAQCGASLCPRQRCPPRSKFSHELGRCVCEKGSVLVEAEFWDRLAPGAIETSLQTGLRGNASHFYGPPVGDNGAACAVCSQRRSCLQDGATRRNSFALPGFFPIDSDNLEFGECLHQPACSGGALGQQAASACGAAYQGLLCAQCRPGFFRSLDFSCSSCSSSQAVSVLTLVAAASLIVGLLAYMVHSNSKGARKPSNPTSVLQKIFLNSLQINALCVSLDVAWPPLASRFLASFTFAGQASSSVLAFDCLIANPSDAFLQRCGAMAVFPFVLVPVVLAVYWLRQMLCGNKGTLAANPAKSPAAVQTKATPQQKVYSPSDFDDLDHGREAPAPATRAKPLSDRVAAASLLLMAFIHPDVSRIMLLLFVCVPAYNSSYLKMNTSIECWGSTHATWVTGVALPVIVLFVIGYPVATYFALRKAGIDKILVKSEAGQDLSAREWRSIDRFSFIVKGYKPRFWYWELLMTGQKLLAMAISVFLRGGGLSQVTSAVVVAMLFLALQVGLQPYSTAHLNKVATFSCVCSLLLLILAQYSLDRVSSFNSTQRERDAQATAESVLSILMVIVTVGFVGVSVINLVRQHKWVRRLRASIASKAPRAGPSSANKSASTIISVKPKEKSKS